MPTYHADRTAYEQAFAARLDGLNAEQRQAVDQIEGPVLVLAGPGTGKTHILAMRIGRILLDTDAAPHNLLCLTFTNAGVRAMRERLLRFIGPEAHRIPIHTFHSFCQQVIQDNLQLFGQHQLQPLADLERIQLFRGLIDELDINNPLKRGRSDPYFYEPHLTTLFSQMKREDWQPEAVEREIDTYLADLPQREAYRYKRNSKKHNYRKGDLKAAKFQEEKQRMDKLRAAVRLFPRYQEQLRRMQRYDYEDMIIVVLRAFETHPTLLRRYQEQFLYLLVDEFQDTNGAQYELLQQLAAYWDAPNVFIVGDDDQSIFEFQGARIHNLSDFFRRHRDALRVVALRQNYRSTQAILDAAHALIGHNRIRLVHQMEDLELDKRLRAGCAFPEGMPEPRFLQYPNRLEEIADVANQIGDLLADGVPAGEIAVIYAKHRQADRLMALLDRKGLVYHSRKQMDILTLPIIDQVRTLLAFVEQEARQPGSSDHLLFRMMHFRCFDIPAADLARFSARLRQQQGEPSARTVLATIAEEGASGFEQPAALLQLQRLLEEWIGLRYELGLPALLEMLVNLSGLLRWAMLQDDAPQQLGALKTFTDHVKEACLRNPHLQLADLLEQLDLMEAHGLNLPMDYESGSSEGVELVTAHSAKGLEFDHVFLLDVEQSSWEDSGGNRFRFSLPDTLTYSGDEDALEARRRLFYVAMTRARRHLTLTCSRQRADGRELLACRFVDELLDAGQLNVEHRSLPPEALREAQIVYLRERQPPALFEPAPALVERLLAHFALSISALNAFLKCPLSFYYDYVLDLPYSPSESALYGQAMHEALQVLFDRMRRTPQHLFPPVEQLLRWFEESMARRRAYFAPEAYRRYLNTGRRDLTAYYREKHDSWPTRVQAEQGVWRVDFEGIPLKGFIDRIDELDPQHVRLLDYKTGTAERGKRYRGRPTDRRPEGGDHWRQMVFYKILFERADPAGRRVRETVISYLEADPDGTRLDAPIPIEPGDVDRVGRMIREVYARIQAQDFFSGCGEARCPWCAFTRKHLPPRLADPEVESLDDQTIP